MFICPSLSIYCEILYFQILPKARHRSYYSLNLLGVHIWMLGMLEELNKRLWNQTQWYGYPCSRPRGKAPWASGPDPLSLSSRPKPVIWEFWVSQDLLSYQLLENALKFTSFLNCGIQDILFKNAYFGGSYKEFNR